METVESYAGTELHRLALHLQYEELGVPFMEYDGWLLPRKFRDLGEEVTLLEDGRGYVDFSDHGILRMEGNDAIDLLHRISTNDFRSFKEGSAEQTVLLSEKGRLVDSVVILHRNDHLLVITGRGAQQHVAQWIEKFIIMEDVKLSNETGRHLLFVHYTPGQGHHASISNGVKAYTFRTKYFDLDSTFHVGDVASSIGARLGSSALVQVGNEAYEVFRIRKGIPAYGKEIAADYNPLELGLRGQMSSAKGCYIGQEVIARLDTYKKVQKKLCRVQVDKILPSNGVYRLIADGLEAGILTSHVPNIGGESGSIGLAMVKSVFAKGSARFLLDDHDSVLTIDDFAENVRSREWK
jgi:folate-binding protein YgfZ